VRVVALDAEPAPKPAAEAPKPAAETKPVAVARPAELKPAAPKPAEPKPAPPKPAEPKPAATAAKPPAPKPATPPAAAKVGFAVQVGAFGDAAEAGALRERLRAAGFTAFTETVETDKGRLTRVRVGPVIDRAAADQLKAQIQAKTGIDGIVRPHP
jgi:cell division septation protein DedD